MLFEHAEDQARELCRIEREGARVILHHFRAGHDGRVEAIEHATFDDARAEYDRQIVLVYERGYRIVRDWVDPPIAHDDALEAMIAEDPDDDARWMVLADWVLAQDDVRANIVRFEQSRRSRDTSETWGQYPVQLFGGATPAALLTEPLAQGRWQAGHVLSCRLVLDRRDGDDVLAAFIAAPATRLVRDLTLAYDSAAMLAAALEALAQAPCRQVLRRLVIDGFLPMAADALAPVLDLVVAPALTGLRLSLHQEQSVLPILDRLAAAPLRPRLRELELGSQHAEVSWLRTRYGFELEHLAKLRLRGRDDREALRSSRG